MALHGHLYPTLRLLTSEVTMGANVRCHSQIQFQMGWLYCTRIIFPLQLCYATTAYKSQGMSLSRAVLNLNNSEFGLGLTHGAVWRVQTSEEVIFESAFNLSRFKEPKGITTRDRVEDVPIGNGQLIWYQRLCLLLDGSAGRLLMSTIHKWISRLPS